MSCDITTKTKHCGGCGQTKPKDQFAKNRLAPDGRQWHCKSCKNEHSKIRKAAIKDGTWHPVRRSKQ